MSTEIGKVNDVINHELNIEVAFGTGGIRLFSTENKIWIDKKGADELIELLETAKSFYR